MLSVELTSHCSCYVFRQYFVKREQCPPDSSAILFKQPKQLNLVPRFPRSTVQMTNYWPDDVILTSSVQYDSSAAGYGELCVWFYPIKNGEIFWMNNNICSCTFVCKKHGKESGAIGPDWDFSPIILLFRSALKIHSSSSPYLPNLG